jgi:Ricin-type beta-trefoil lectin domain
MGAWLLIDNQVGNVLGPLPTHRDPLGAFSQVRIRSPRPGFCPDQGISAGFAPGRTRPLCTTPASAAVGSSKAARAGLSSADSCVTVNAVRTASGTKVVASWCVITSRQRWKDASNGHLTGKRSGKCLNDPGAGRNGTKLQIAACNNAAAEHLEPALTRHVLMPRAEGQAAKMFWRCQSRYLGAGGWAPAGSSRVSSSGGRP